MEQMRIVVAGGSGFIGRHLISALVAEGHTVTMLTRAQPESHKTPAALLRHMHWDPLTADGELADVLASTDAVVNLAGANIGSRRWTKQGSPSCPAECGPPGPSRRLRCDARPASRRRRGSAR